MTTRPYELLVRFSQDGAVAGAHIRTITSVNGRDYESDPIPLASTDDPAFTDFASQFSAAAIAEKESVKTELEKLQSEYNSKVAEVDSANVTIAQLQARIDELTSRPIQPVATMGQVRKWLILNYGPAIIQQVNALINAIPDEIQRAAAMSDWEYANIMLRENPLVEQLGAALGMKVEQLDAAYLEASQLP